MTAKELKIGNLLTDTMCNIFEVTCPSDKYFSVELLIPCESSDKYIFSKRPLNPIPLTTEWLRRMGFEKDRKGGNYWFKYYGISGIFYITNDKNYGDNRWYLMISELEYVRIGEYFYNVHQLQNIYFALTGEELEIDKK